MSTCAQWARIAAETVGIAQGGSYLAPSGAVVSVRDAVQLAVQQTELITPGQTRSLRSRADALLSRRGFKTTFDVRNETTFAAARRLVLRFGAGQVAALNFASAKNPGGGFLSGSQAQEESLARASALHACLANQTGYYDANRRAPSNLYTDHMIVSPRVPVFREDDGGLLEEPWEVTIITSPAPNAGAIAKNKPRDLPHVEPTFRRRIEQVLSAAVTFDQTALVLGAWGCGVFANDPAMVARLFGEFLLGDGPFAAAFEHVEFAVLDRQGDTIAPFAGMFGPSVENSPAT
ncbi:MAG: hypothetical protein JWL69_148 [Phycisphaerales bacterium]|nr:hypothetical protein [Phycisphaerales bacterium]